MDQVKGRNPIPGRHNTSFFAEEGEGEGGEKKNPWGGCVARGHSRRPKGKTHSSGEGDPPKLERSRVLKTRGVKIGKRPTPQLTIQSQPTTIYFVEGGKKPDVQRTREDTQHGRR